MLRVEPEEFRALVLPLKKVYDGEVVGDLQGLQGQENGPGIYNIFVWEVKLMTFSPKIITWWEERG